MKRTKTKLIIIFFSALLILAVQEAKSQAPPPEAPQIDTNTPQEDLKELQRKAREAFLQAKAKESYLRKKVRQERFKNWLIALKQNRERKAEIKLTKKRKRHVEIITNENDPIYILDAEVKDSISDFLKIENVEFKYWLKLHNQTPKIVDSVFIIWERKIPFTESLTISKKTKISKPFIPYEKRVIEYNDLDSKREGESYSVKIARIVFEDGTQWLNPYVKDKEL